MRRIVPFLPVMLAIPFAIAAHPSSSSAADPTVGSIHILPLSPIGISAPTDTCNTTACKELLALIKGAKERIDFAIYGLRGQTAILEALTDAKARGIAIRGIVDKDDKDKTYYADTDELQARIGTVRSDHLHDKAAAEKESPYDPATDRCARPVGFAGPLQCVGYDLGDKCLVSAQASAEELVYDGDIMHDKFFVVDGRYVWTGSANISDSDITGYSANLAVYMDSPAMAAQYTREIDQMYDAGNFHENKTTYAEEPVMIGDTRVTVWFPPEGDPVGALRKEIQGAKESIDVAIFYLTHKQIAGDLIAAHLRGVKVRVIVDATSATNGYTKHELLRAAGIPVKVENWGGKMHAKTVDIDHKVVFAGSMNWTTAGYKSNDENYLRIESPAIAKVWDAWYAKLWTDIPDKWLQGRPAPESLDSGTACTDKSDNDFDSKRDAEDEGCGPNPPPLTPLPPWKIVPKTDGYDLIKGNITTEGKKQYEVPTSADYGTAQIDPTKGEAYFCSEDDAKAAGFKRARQATPPR